MRNLLVNLFFLTFTIGAPGASAGVPVSSEHLSQFAKVIRSHGFTCNRATEGDAVDRTSRGQTVFKIVCDNFNYVYRVATQGTTGRWVVEDFFK